MAYCCTQQESLIYLLNNVQIAAGSDPLTFQEFQELNDNLVRGSSSAFPVQVNYITGDGVTLCTCITEMCA